ncbi:peptidylprolyl isomerase [Leuconostoc carnosum]|uniref:Peptidyl-prolyl cis-trans isomerase n=2 Tax=Leuconostoc carnosum TaxID=1252 RepID=K0D7L0_LEUCJ|nr:peptidylprolyl isomerase [Leuconostoc carnosum]AFT81934.1 peptidyl-prolyl cis-trans isomerase [Leuconostoc carnosum JB16]KAA8328511.1 peptidylprolyl isomerase [Leuconostoc carnosum]QEA34013.1 peptidylprolyl isomerase [Leuconostoc carnosum]
MTKKNQYILLATISTLLVIIIVSVIVMMSNQTSSDNTKSDPALNNVALPQLNQTVTDKESEVKLETTYGDVTIKLFNQYAPLAVENFLTHAKAGYYDHTIFHRVMADFMIQGGDPKGNGSGGESIWHDKDKQIDSGKGFKNEISTSLYNIRGALSMANAGENTNGSQFFINQNSNNQAQKIDKNNYPNKIATAYKKGGNPQLDGSYTVFGQVMSGMNVVDKIANAKVKTTGEGSEPIAPVKINHITILKEVK